MNVLKQATSDLEQHAQPGCTGPCAPISLRCRCRLLTSVEYHFPSFGGIHSTIQESLRTIMVNVSFLYIVLVLVYATMGRKPLFSTPPRSHRAATTSVNDTRNTLPH